MDQNSSALEIVDPRVVALSRAAISVNAIVSIPLNAYVIFLILSRASLAPDIFSLNLAASETLYSLLSLTYFGILEPNRHFLLFIEIFLFSIGLIFIARPLFQCCICVEYYVGVVHPVVFLRCRPLRYRVTCCGAAWLVITAGCLYSKFVMSNNLYRYVFLSQNLLLVSVMVFCCVCVLRALRRPGPGKGGPVRRGGDPAKRRAFNIILLIMTSTVVNMLLLAVSIPLQCCLSEQELDLAWVASTNLALFTGLTLPLLYLHRAGKLDCCRRT